MESIDETQFPNSTQYLHASDQAMSNFIESVKNEPQQIKLRPTGKLNNITL